MSKACLMLRHLHDLTVFAAGESAIQRDVDVLADERDFAIAECELRAACVLAAKANVIEPVWRGVGIACGVNRIGDVLDRIT